MDKWHFAGQNNTLRTAKLRKAPNCYKLEKQALVDITLKID